MSGTRSRRGDPLGLPQDRRGQVTLKGRPYKIAVTLPLALLSACVAGSPVAQAPGSSSVDVVELSAVDARARIEAGTLTSRALTQAYLDRIAGVDDDGPRLNSVIELNSAALADADALDTEQRAGKRRGPLHGLPVLIKDNIDAAGMVNSAGSLAMAEHRPRQDAFVIARLRAAGAVILGRTNLSEWANFRSNRSTSGWSSRGGQTKNPYVLDRNPCGSSSGTGTAIAASLAAVGVGTETDGSIICPSAVNGLVGLKPTLGLVSRSGIIPISISQDTAGPMGRSVADVALLMTAMAGVDPADPAATAAQGRIAADYSTALDPNALAGKRIGVLRQAVGAHPAVAQALESALTTMRARGATVIDVTVERYGDWGDPELQVLLYEFKDGLNRYLQQSGAPHESLAALIAWNRSQAERVMPWFGQELFEQAEAKGPLTEPAYQEARATSLRGARDRALLASLDRERLDALVAPSMSAAWPTDLLLGDHFTGDGSAVAIAAIAGTPSITVPVTQHYGLPLAVTLLGRAYGEADLLALAYALEQATKARRPPQFLPTLTLP